jgi:hypothetical protein
VDSQYDCLKLIDWDTVRWAPRERDLWALGDGAWVGAYGDDVPLSDDALDVYRLQWLLVDVADFVPLLIEAQAATDDAEIAMGEIRSYLPMSGGSG